MTVPWPAELGVKGSQRQGGHSRQQPVALLRGDCRTLPVSVRSGILRQMVYSVHNTQRTSRITHSENMQSRTCACARRDMPLLHVKQAADKDPLQSTGHST